MRLVNHGNFQLTKDEQSLKTRFLNDFDEMNRTQSEEEYEQRWERMQKEYSRHGRLVRYLREEQYPKRKEVAKPWTSKILHYGNTSTSKLEGTHRTLKEYLRTSKGTLLYLLQCITNVIGNWLHNYKADLATSYMRPKPAANAKKIACCDDNLNKFITNHAMDLFAKQLALAQSEDMKLVCNGHFQAIYGIPCCHTIKKFIDRGDTFTADDFDEHWLWERDGCEVVDIAGIVRERRANRPLVLEPQKVVRKRGRPKEARSGRILSQFEATAPSNRQRPINISDDDDSGSEASIEPSPKRQRQRLSPTADTGGFIPIDDPSLAESIDLTGEATPAPASATTTVKKRASKTTTPKPSASRRSQAQSKEKKPRGRVGKARREAVSLEIVAAASAAGCPLSAQQLTALETNWMKHTPTASFGTLLIAMTHAGKTLSKPQHRVMEGVINGSSNGSK